MEEENRAHGQVLGSRHLIPRKKKSSLQKRLSGLSKDLEANQIRIALESQGRECLKMEGVIYWCKVKKDENRKPLINVTLCVSWVTSEGTI